jgi:hypothetical protein
MPGRRTESESFPQSGARRPGPDEQVTSTQVVSVQDSTPLTPEKFTYLRDKRAAIREGGLKDGLGKRLDRFGMWKNYGELVTAAKDDQNMGHHGRWSGSSIEECQQPNLYDDLSFLDSDPRSKRYYRQLRKSHTLKRKKGHPRFVVVPCNNTWKTKLLDTYVKMGEGSPLEKMRSFVDWDFRGSNVDWSSVNALSHLMSKWLRHGNLSRQEVYTGRGSNEAMRIDE